MPFSEQTFRFLVENRQHNSREWYHAHKAAYQQYVLAPLVELVEQLRPTVLSIDPQLVAEPKVGKSISRIYRDTRYTKDKSLYRDVVWTLFARPRTERISRPGLVFEASPDGFRYGVGYYEASTQSMQAMRTLILQGDPAFERADCAYRRQKCFTMQGESYKRPRFTQQPPQQCEWLNRRNIAFMHDSRDFARLYAPNLHEQIAQGFQLLSPIYQFFVKVEAQRQDEAMQKRFAQGI